MSLLEKGDWGQALHGGSPFPAVAPQQGEDRLAVRVFGFSTVSVVGVRFLREHWRGEMGAHKWGDFLGPVPDT